MKITAQEEYGLRCLLQLARANGHGGLTVKEIATREGLSSAYVEKLLRLLSQVGITQSVRGMRGGYLLGKKPEELTLGMVVRALGSVPKTAEICDRYKGHLTSCIHIDNCCIRAAWETLTQAIQGFLDQTYLSELIDTEAKTRAVLGHRIAMEGPFSV